MVAGKTWERAVSSGPGLREDPQGRVGPGGRQAGGRGKKADSAWGLAAGGRSVLWPVLSRVQVVSPGGQEAERTGAWSEGAETGGCWMEGQALY